MHLGITEKNNKFKANVTIEIPNSFAFGINSTNASNFTALVFIKCH
jgi:hypothetical protein